MNIVDVDGDFNYSSKDKRGFKFISWETRGSK